jgi:hypothetical protein
MAATAATAIVTIAAGCAARSSPRQSSPRSSLPRLEASSTTTSTTTTAEAADDPVESASGRAELDRYRQQLANPVSSDLPPDLFAELTDLGTRVEIAYLTGVGREEWPGYFGPDNVAPLWRDVQVAAAGARSRNGATDAVEVTVVWSRQPVDAGAVVEGHISVVLLTLRNGTWQPAAQFG